MEEYLPTIPVSEFIVLLQNSTRIQGIIDVGDTKAFVLNGSKPIGRRIINIRTDLPELGYELAMGYAIIAGIISPCMEWFYIHKNFKEGGYIVPQDKKI